jgi:membrane-bound lytic murein transglycosylase MltF
MDFATFDAMAPEEKACETFINQVSLATAVPPCALAAIARRESNFVASAQSDDGGWGLCQITAGASADGHYSRDGRLYNLLDARDNLVVAASYFLEPAIEDMIAFRKTNTPFMDSISTEILFFAFCCYNEGIRGTENHISQRMNPDWWSTNSYGAGTLYNYHRYLAMSHAGGS